MEDQELKDKIILTGKKTEMMEINNQILERLTGKVTEYRSFNIISDKI
jgi:hypothetical protein